MARPRKKKTKAPEKAGDAKNPKAAESLQTRIALRVQKFRNLCVPENCQFPGCESCVVMRRFSDQAKHLWLHATRRFACETCGHRATRPEGLKRHRCTNEENGFRVVDTLDQELTDRILTLAVECFPMNQKHLPEWVALSIEDQLQPKPQPSAAAASGPDDLQCEKCSEWIGGGVSADQAEKIVAHAAEHLDSKMFACSKCVFRSSTPRTMIVHVKDRHRNFAVLVNACTDDSYEALTEFIVENFDVEMAKLSEALEAYKRNPDEPRVLGTTLFNTTRRPRPPLDQKIVVRLGKYTSKVELQTIYTCKTCKQAISCSTATNVAKGLVNHAMIHLNLTPFRCKICKIATRNIGKIRKGVDATHACWQHKEIFCTKEDYARLRQLTMDIFSVPADIIVPWLRKFRPKSNTGSAPSTSQLQYFPSNGWPVKTDSPVLETHLVDKKEAMVPVKMENLEEAFDSYFNEEPPPLGKYDTWLEMVSVKKEKG